MVSARKVAANRANARRSTGPKTARGRARSARNAVRHGLSVPVLADPDLRGEAMALVRQIGGPVDLALAVAQATLEVRRVRARRHELVSRFLASVPRLEDGRNDPDVVWRRAAEGAARGLAEIGPVLLRLDAYERRAVSR